MALFLLAMFVVYFIYQCWQLVEFTASVVGEYMWVMQHWWNDIDKHKPWNLEFICQKYHMSCPHSDISNLFNVVVSYFMII
jgi:hypothetical protein